MTTHYSRNIKTLFKKSKSVKSIKHIDVWEELHGEQREWWDRQHLFPKELSIYDHGKLVRSTKWYLNGLIKLNLAVIGNALELDASNCFPYSTQSSFKMIEMSAGGTLTIPLDSNVNFPIGTAIDILQTSSSQVTLAVQSGVTVNGTPGLKIRTQWSSATIVKRAANTWVAMGDLVA